jgi:uncharacterized Zn finger protein (UPF0148 family)
MNSVPCPGCGLPRQADQVGVVPCPVCADDERAKAPEGSHPPLAQESHDPTRGLPADVSELTKTTSPRKPLPLAPLMFAAGVAVGVCAVLGWQAFRAARETAAAKSPVAAVTKEPIAIRPPDAKPAPAPKPLAVAPPPRVYVAIAPIPHTPFRPPPARITQVDHPNAEYTPQVPPGATVTLKGRAKILRVPTLERGAALDTTQLEVETVFVGKIDGGSKLRIGSVKHRVTFQAKIDGRSTVEVVAPTGTVWFAVATSPGKDGSRIAGGSEVRITANVARFDGQIGGLDTLVSVTLTRGGSLGFAEIDGPCRLEYRKASPTDPDPTVSAGKVSAASKLARVD